MRNTLEQLLLNKLNSLTTGQKAAVVAVVVLDAALWFSIGLVVGAYFT